jgi:hypothetical protein
MKREPITLPITQLQRQLSAVVEQIHEHGLQVVVTRRGVPILGWYQPGSIQVVAPLSLSTIALWRRSSQRGRPLEHA